MQTSNSFTLWQELLLPYRRCFHDHRGFARFLEWTTGLALNVEEHTITQSLVGLNRTHDWRAVEAFAEYGSWDTRDLERVTAELLEEAPGRLWYGYHVWAGDDTKVHRSSKDVWGTCTFYEPSARCPNRASTVRAHNWVVLGALLHNPEQPAWFLPVAGRLYFRRSQLPAQGNSGEETACFHTKCELLVELARQQAQVIAGHHLVVFDGGFAKRSVVRPLLLPEDEQQSPIDFITRLRSDSRLFALPPERRPGQRGRSRRWGRPLPPPRQGGRWPGGWHEGKAWIYGRKRKVRWKEVICLWHVLGWEKPVKAVVAEVEGYKQRFTLVCSATELTGLQIVELFCGRFRQEDGFRDLKQRLGWEECRAWTRLPILRTSCLLWLTLTTLRRLQFKLQDEGVSWWSAPPWNRRKERPSVLDAERWLRSHGEEIRQGLSAWLAEMGKKEANAVSSGAN